MERLSRKQRLAWVMMTEETNAGRKGGARWREMWGVEEQRPLCSKTGVMDPQKNVDMLLRKNKAIF